MSRVIKVAEGVPASTIDFWNVSPLRGVTFGGGGHKLKVEVTREELKPKDENLGLFAFDLGMLRMQFHAQEMLGLKTFWRIFGV